MMKPVRAACTAAVVVVLSCAAWAQDVSKVAVRFAIEAQPLRVALNEWAQQAGLSVIWPAGQAEATAMSPRVEGSLRPEQALHLLLEGSGLTYKFVDDQTVAVQAEEASRPRQIAMASTATYEGTAEPSVAQMRTESEQSASAGVGTQEDRSAEAVLEEVVVTGTHIRGTTAINAPAITVTREDLQKTAFTTLEGLFESLPQNFDGVTADGRFANEGGSLVARSNDERAVALDLRGLGPQSTLTLLNGERRAGSVGGRVVDVSVIPLSVIERVEVVTGGRSAIYGADAVAGVVNLITRRDFAGAESQISYSTPSEYSGGERLRLSQIFGRKFERGGFVAAYDYGRDQYLDLAKPGMLSLRENPIVAQTQLALTYQADVRQNSGFLAGHWMLTDRIELHADGLYTDRNASGRDRSLFSGAPTESFSHDDTPTEQYSISAGASIDLDAAWALNVSAVKGRSNVLRDVDARTDIGGGLVFIDNFIDDSTAKISSASVVADGPLAAWGSVVPRLAIGASFRNEEFAEQQVFNTFPLSDYSNDRDVTSGFVEVLLPWELHGSGGHEQSLELSIAGRYDDYSDFGDTFNPQVALAWRPFGSLTLRGSYAEAFRAPALIELANNTQAFLENIPDPLQGGAPLPALILGGSSGDLEAERAKTWQLGIDFSPAALPNSNLSLSYFSIDYDDRIEQPMVNADRPLALAREERYPGLIDRTPSADEVAAFIAANTVGFISNTTGIPWDPVQDPNPLSVFPNLITLDNRIGNIASETVRGLDLKLATRVDLASGRLDLGLNSTYTLDHDRKITTSSPAVGLLNEVGKPADLRFRASAGWTRSAYGAFLYVNYTDSYSNPFSTPVSQMPSWVTLDLTLRFDGSALNTTRLLGGLSANLSVSNLSDKTPPHFGESLQGLLYDSANASPLGRLISLNVMQRW